jgi:hypothetical protein
MLYEKRSDSRPVVMFASAEVEVGHPFAEVQAILEGGSAWLPGLIEEAGRDTFQLLDTVTRAGSAPRFPVRQEVRIHPPVHWDGLVLPTDWTSTAPEALFRAGELDLEALPLEQPDRTQIRVDVRFRVAADGAGERSEGVMETAQAYTRRLAELIAAHLHHQVAA